LILQNGKDVSKYNYNPSFLFWQFSTVLQKTTKEYLSNTTIHGFNYIERKTSFLITR
jgi:hypothetical protein